MYRSFSVGGFRCLDKLELTGLKRINLIIGKNNVGKSSVLEALFLRAGGNNPFLLNAVQGVRGAETLEIDPSGENPWATLFGDLKTSEPITLEGIYGGQRSSLEIAIPDNAEEVENLYQRLDPALPLTVNRVSASGVAAFIRSRGLSGSFDRFLSLDGRSQAR